MMQTWIVMTTLAVYVAFLVAVAYVGERKAFTLSEKNRTWVLGLSLAVYCTSWTFYGAVGSAMHHRLAYIPIYLGPLIFLWVGFGFWSKIAVLKEQYHFNSIADFLTIRYGKSALLGGMVAGVAIASILPYLALQLHAIEKSATVLLGKHATLTQGINPVHLVLVFTLLLSGLAMFFGTRHNVDHERHHSLMMVIAIESFIKLIALVAVAVYALIHYVPNSFTQYTHHAYVALANEGWPKEFWSQTVLAACALFCLPRQFHVSVVECANARQLPQARFIFSVYLLLILLAVIPICEWALQSLPITAMPDMAVLSLPLMDQQYALALLTFMGGFSAAVAMLLVSTITLSIMLSNDVIVPVLLRLKLLRQQHVYLAPTLQIIRYGSILIIMVLGYGVYRVFNNINQLSSIGLLAFSGVAQFAPLMLGAIYFRGGSKQGAIAGLSIGFLLWLYCLVIPSVVASTTGQMGSLSFLEALVREGPWGIHLLKPQSLLGTHFDGVLTHGVLWSLGLNCLVFIWVSKLRRPSIIEQIQAEPFLTRQRQDALISYTALSEGQTSDTLSAVMSQDKPTERIKKDWRVRLTIGDLMALCYRIIGPERTQKSFANYLHEQRSTLDVHRVADRGAWQLAEQLLAGVVGAASARTLLQSALSAEGLGVAQIASLLDQTSEWQRFSERLLVTMLDQLSMGVSVIDRDLRLAAWNKHYVNLFHYPESMLTVGRPIADLIRYNAELGELGAGEVEHHVNKRIAKLQQGQPYRFERKHRDGRVIELIGRPIAGGGFVTTFTDITAFKQTELMLEQKVHERTQQLENALQEQRNLREIADQANLSKSKFVAAASHDLLQPMHAARLFAATLESNIITETGKHTLMQLERALHGAESILSALLDVARLDSGVMNPKMELMNLQELVDDFKLQFASIAQQRKLDFRVYAKPVYVITDAEWLRRIIQNLLANAFRYTQTGRVVLGVRHNKNSSKVRIGVWDTGPGIASKEMDSIFSEFKRGENESPWGEKGLGLGLSIVWRMTQRLSIPLRVYSPKHQRLLLTSRQPVVGMCFEIELTAVTITKPMQQIQEENSLQAFHETQLRILCLDNEQVILDAMHPLLSKWGHEVHCVASTAQAVQMLAHHHFDVWLVDYHLGDTQTGLDFIQNHRKTERVVLLTATTDPDVMAQCKMLGVRHVNKPIKPATLRAFLRSVRT